MAAGAARDGSRPGPGDGAETDETTEKEKSDDRRLEKEKPSAPPRALLEHGPVASFTNGALRALNELRHCARGPRAACAARTREALTRAATALEATRVLRRGRDRRGCGLRGARRVFEDGCAPARGVRERVQGSGGRRGAVSRGVLRASVQGGGEGRGRARGGEAAHRSHAHVLKTRLYRYRLAKTTNLRTYRARVLFFFRELRSRFSSKHDARHAVVHPTRTMPKRVLSPSADALSLSDMPEHILERLALELSPPDAFAFVSTSKRLFWNSQRRGAGALGVRILQAALKRHLDAVLEGITSPSADSVDSQGSVKRKRNALSCEDLFPPHLVVSARDEKWNAADVDIFCTWRAAEFVRERLMAKNMICSGVDNTYGQQGRDLNGDFEHSSFAVISHVESYAARPKTGVTSEYGLEDIAYDSDAYYARAKAWGATAVADMPKFASVGGPVRGRDSFRRRGRLSVRLQLARRELATDRRQTARQRCARASRVFRPRDLQVVLRREHVPRPRRARQLRRPHESHPRGARSSKSSCKT